MKSTHQQQFYLCGMCNYWTQYDGSKYISFRKPYVFTVYFFMMFRILITPRKFYLQFVQDLVRINNWWNLQFSTTVISLNTSIPTIYSVIPSVLYLICRVSLQSSCDILSRLVLRCATPLCIQTTRWGKFNQKHNYEYVAKLWWLWAIKIHFSAYSGHHQVLTNFLL